MKIERRQMAKYILTFAGLALSKNAFSIVTKGPGQTFINKNASDNEEPNVVNAGVGGNNTADLLTRIDKDCLAYKPELTILMIGTNDMNSMKYVPLDLYKQNLISLIKKIEDIGSKVLLLTILPVYEPYLLTRHPSAFYQPEGVSGRMKQLNDTIAEVAQTYNINLLDIGSRFEVIGKIGLDKDSLIQNLTNTGKTDGVHPTPNGYRFIGLLVYDYIIDHTLPTNNIVCFGDSITHGDGSIDKESYPAYLLKLLKAKNR